MTDNVFDTAPALPSAPAAGPVDKEGWAAWEKSTADALSKGAPLTRDNSPGKPAAILPGTLKAPERAEPGSDAAKRAELMQLWDTRRDPVTGKRLSEGNDALQKQAFADRVALEQMPWSPTLEKRLEELRAGNAGSDFRDPYPNLRTLDVESGALTFEKFGGSDNADLYRRFAPVAAELGVSQEGFVKLAGVFQTYLDEIHAANEARNAPDPKYTNLMRK